MQGLISLAAGLDVGRKQFRLANRLPSIRISGPGQTPQLGHSNVCYDLGTPANYSIVLPDARGQDGRIIEFRMSSGLSKFATLTGFAGQTINGLATRVMWMYEFARLVAEGGNWYKQSGLSIPMLAKLVMTGDQTIAHNSVSKVLLDVSADDNTGQMVDVTNKRINVVRPSNYMSSGVVILSTAAAGTRIITQVKVTGTAIYNAEVPSTGGVPSPFGVSPKTNLTLTDYVELFCYQNTGVNATAFGTTSGTGSSSHITLSELPSW